MVLLDAPGTGCSGSSVIARNDAPWSAPWSGNNMPTALTDFEGNKGDSFSQASEKCGLLVVIYTGVDRARPEGHP